MKMQVDKSNIDVAIATIREQLFEHKLISIEVKKWRKPRSIPQNAMFHAWLAELERYFHSNGFAHITKEQLKRDLKATFLGFEEIEYRDTLTNEVYTRPQLRRTSELSGEHMYHFMSQVYGWALENIGYMLKVEHDSEFAEFKRKEIE